MTTTGLLLISLALGTHAQLSSSSGAFNFGGSSSSLSTTQSAVNAQTTVQLFIDAGSDQGFVGAVVAADACSTTYDLICTEGDYGSGALSATCDPSATAVATYAPGFFGLSTEADTAGVRVTLIESCSLDGTTLAVCEASISASANGQHTATKTTTTRSGADVHYFNVPITAGASKLSGLAKCTASGNAAPAATGAVDLVKVLIVPGAAALLAGAGMFA